MTDPYQVLGISRSAGKDEIKKAYRTLSRKYHPDANVNNPNKEYAEEKFKEIQQAYQQIMDEKDGGYYQEYGGFSGRYTSGYARDAQEDEMSMHLRAAANYIRNGYYKEAVNVLNQIREKSGQWYYLSAIANEGLGDHILAVEYARQATYFEPDNSQYISLLRQLESGTAWYQDMRSAYGGDSSRSDICARACLSYAACTCCLNGQVYCLNC